MTKPLIIHVSGDVPDAVQPRKTRAVLNLVKGTGETFEHRVYSLNRVPLAARGRLSRPGAVEIVADDDRIVSLTYAAPARGFFLATAMRRVAEAILADVERRRLRPAVVQGHKLSIEGFAARCVATALSIPYALSLQGDTDQKVLSIRRDLWARYREVYLGAAAIFPFAPWIARWCDARLGFPAKPPIILPCVLASDTILTPVSAPAKIITAFHLESWRRKNVRTLLAAGARVPDMTLDIAGDGPDTAKQAIDAMIEREGMNGRAHRIGYASSAVMQPRMNGAAAFAMPSLRETFGMVFAESLLAGCPIVYPEGRALDGYLDGCGFALAVPSRDVAAVAEAIKTLIGDQERRKAELARGSRPCQPQLFGATRSSPPIATGFRRSYKSTDQIPLALGLGAGSLLIAPAECIPARAPAEWLSAR